jgi:hypothetical protein
MNEFERKLERQPLRPIPREWKAEIFAALDRLAQRPASTCEGSDSERFAGSAAMVEGGHLLRLSALWREWLWPSPAAWAALLALWAGLLALYFSAPQTRATVATQPTAPLTSAPRGSLLAFQTQHGLAAEVVGIRHHLQ